MRAVSAGSTISCSCHSPNQARAEILIYRCLNKERITVGESVKINPGIGNLSNGYGRTSEYFERESFNQRTIDGDLLGMEKVVL